jgi:tetratricopeptide (TPR) repeat protein
MTWQSTHTSEKCDEVHIRWPLFIRGKQFLVFNLPEGEINLMSHRQTNAIIAGVIFWISFLTYLSTMAITTSFWDCGEFIACSYILGVPHPPGAPLYILVGRIFSMLPTSADIGFRVNVMSPIISGITAMLTYLIIVRLLMIWKGQPQTWTKADRISIYASGIIGALAFAFSDSQWFNSVEAEVYAGSMFFTAIVIWLILKWMDYADSPQADRYVLIIFYIMGLAIGVHLLNLLALPPMAMIMYARLHKPSAKEDRFNEFLMMSVAAGVAFAIVMLINSGVTIGSLNIGLVKGIPSILSNFGIETLAFLVLALVGLAIWSIKEKKRIASLVFSSLFLLVLGYSTYSALYIRSGLNPAIDENNPDNPERLVKYLNREQYGDWSITERRAPLWEYQIKKMYVRYFGWQFIGKGADLDDQGRTIKKTIDENGRVGENTLTLRGLWGLPFIIGLLGMLYHFQRDWRRAYPVFVLFIVTGLAIIAYLNQEDPQPRERDYAYTGSFFAFALWIGIGVTALVDMIKEMTVAKTAKNGRVDGAALAGMTWVLSALAFIAVPVNMFKFNYHEHNRQGNYVAYDYSYNILQSCEPNAIIFTNGDNDTFPLWFLQYVKNVRRDVRVVNLSLLNTDWYIKQLRDEEPRVPINLNDAHIEGLQAIPWQKQNVKIEVPKATYEQAYNDILRLDSTIVREENPAISVEVEPTLYGQGIRVQDLMVLKILEDNKFRRPVYFAVTVSPDNKLNLDNYMRMDGLAFKVLPVKISNRRIVDPQLMWTNLNEKFQYRNLNNPKVYYDDNTKSLLGNYRSAFLTLAQYHTGRYEKYKNVDLQAYNPETRAWTWQNDKERALQVLDRMSEVIPESVIPTGNFQLNLAIGQMYEQLGKPAEMDKRLRTLGKEESSNLTPAMKVQLADYVESYFHRPAIAESLVQALVESDPNFSEGAMWLSGFYSRQGNYRRSLEVLQQWLTRHPEDQKAKAQLEQIKILVRADSVAQAARPVDAPSDTASKK